MEEADIEAAPVPSPPRMAVAAAAAAETVRGLMAEAMCLFLAVTAQTVVLGVACAMWVNYCAFLASLMACVQGAALVKAAFVVAGLLCLAVFAVFSVAAVGLVLLVCLVALLMLLLWCHGRRGTPEAGAGETGADGPDGGGRMPAAQLPAGTESAGGLCHQKVFDRGDLVVVLMTIAAGLLLLLLPATDCFEDGVCSMPMDIRCFANSVAVLLRYFTNFFGPTKR